MAKIVKKEINVALSTNDVERKGVNVLNFLLSKYGLLIFPLLIFLSMLVFYFLHDFNFFKIEDNQFKLDEFTGEITSQDYFSVLNFGFIEVVSFLIGILMVSFGLFNMFKASTDFYIYKMRTGVLLVSIGFVFLALSVYLM